jgi:hypothetical protein
MKELHERTTLPKLSLLANRIWKEIRQVHKLLMTVQAGRNEGENNDSPEVDDDLHTDES